MQGNAAGLTARAAGFPPDSSSAPLLLLPGGEEARYYSSAAVVVAVVVMVRAAEPVQRRPSCRPFWCDRFLLVLLLPAG